MSPGAESDARAGSRGVERRTFPVNLLLEGRPALVVGGGRVALHKAEILLAAGALVTLVSPEVIPEGAALAGSIRHIERGFEDGDLDGFFIVFAATDDPEFNGRVLERCRELGLLCGAVDANWRKGDFITPAVLRRDGLTIAVSTGGRSCLRSRLVKEGLARAFDETGIGRDASSPERETK